MHTEILRRLDAIEREQDVRIIYACESGSLAWGFASPDSDYDVRFIYVRPRDWYLSIRLGRDVIERPIVDQIDLSGWDLRKALQLFQKSNAPLMEWLVSPIIYRERGPIPGALREMRPRAYSPRAASFHYWRMAERTYEKSIREHEEVQPKGYFYTLRPILAVQWLKEVQSPPPMEFQVLLDRLLPSGPIRGAIEGLLTTKREAREGSTIPAIPLLNEYVEENLAALRKWAETAPVRGVSTEELDEVFRLALAEHAEEINYRPIGIVHSPFPDIKGMPIQPTGATKTQGTVEVFPQFAEGLRDLEGFSHIILLYHFHQAQESRLLVTPFLDSRPHGVFATRAPTRPNPIGLSIVRLLSIEQNTLHIENVDILDGTPLLDIKPYVPEFDQHPADRVGWLEQARGRVRDKRSDDRFRGKEIL